MSEVLLTRDVRSGPVIGISAYREQAQWGKWETEAVVLPHRYPDRVAEAGGVPVLLPAVPGIGKPFSGGMAPATKAPAGEPVVV